MADGIHIPSPGTFFASADETPAAVVADEAPESQVENAAETVPKRKAPLKKRAAPKSAAPGEDAVTGALADPVTKPKQTKSRNGCLTCKIKRLKCDEEKPTCQQCARRGVECGGYKKEFKWRPQFQETGNKITFGEPIKAPIGKQPSLVNGDGAKSLTPPDEGRRDSKRVNPNEYSTMTLPSRPAKAKKPAAPTDKQARKSNSPPRASTSLSQRRADSIAIPQSVNSNSASPPNFEDSGHMIMPQGVPSPTLTEILGPLSEEDMTPSHEQPYIHFTMPEDMAYPLSPLPLLDPQLMNNYSTDSFDDFNTPDGETFVPGVLPVFITPRRDPSSSASRSPARAETSPSWTNSVARLYNQPNFAPDSPEMLAFRFDKFTCGILSIMDGPNENPWRTVMWPLSQSSPAVYHALMAMTAFHASWDVPSLRVVGHEHKQKSIRFIHEGIKNDSIQNHSAIATALTLGFSEAWDQHTATGGTHIKGAQVLVKQALQNHQRNPLQGVELARLKFLSNAYVYLDVLSRLTSFDSDVNNDFDNFLFASDAPDIIMDDQGFGIDFGMPIDARLDPLMGCANTLFPMIGRVANLVRRVCRSQANSPAIISQANDLKLDLEAWEPPEYIETPQDRTTGIQHTLQTAEAYRWATILHLHQAVPEIPSPSTNELATRVLQYLATVPLASRTVITHTMPLLIAGCEATSAEDRQWIRDRWVAMNRRIRLGVTEKCSIVTEEVWRRRDVYEAQPSTRRRLVATSELQPSRQKSAPLVRTDDGFEDMDPGRTGMVFSYVEENEPVVVHDNTPRRPEHRKSPSRRGIKDRIIGPMDVAYTPRGHLHWIGVMWDWGWEVLLG